MLAPSAYGFWPFDFFKKERDPLPPYVLQHPMMDEGSVYGVGSGKSFLEAKSKALNDIATQLRSDVRSITSVHKNSDTGTTSDQQITVLTQRLIDNYTIVDETHANGEVYLLIRHAR
ncbi:MAG: LPP20 family lipoprotein [Campylobacterales bacterium]|nr:LPP20 family lipoprotein [Campylobacterales bacterium]